MTVKDFKGILMTCLGDVGELSQDKVFSLNGMTKASLILGLTTILYK